MARTTTCPFQNPGQLNSGMPGGAVPGNVPGAPPAGVAAQGLAQYIDVKSYVFDVQVHAEINGYKRIFHGIIGRDTGTGQNLKCVKFYWE